MSGVQYIEHAHNSLRSLNCQRESTVHFVNRTLRNANLLWLDYNGRRVLYAMLMPGQTFHMRTFVTHPWIFRDADTGDKLVTQSKDDVFFPPANSGGDATVNLEICLPMYSLYMCCLQAVRKLIPESQIGAQAIPREVKNDLRNRENVPYMVHMEL